MQLAEQADDEILRVATPIMDNLMQGSTEIDHAKHVRDFTERAKKALPREALERQCRTYQAKWGRFRDRELLGICRKRDSVTILWRQRVTRIPDEFTAVLTLVQEGDRYLADRVWVF